MSIFSGFWQMVFGNQSNVLRETVEVFRENSEASAVRAADRQSAALQQFASEFRTSGRGVFDRLMDGINRLPRPLMALGTLGLMGSAMVDPLWFAARMQGIALVPEPLWWVLGIVISFYFGARSQAKAEDFQQAIAASLSRVPQVVDNLHALETFDQTAPKPQKPDANTQPSPASAIIPASPQITGSDNPALKAWRASAAAH